MIAYRFTFLAAIVLVLMVLGPDNELSIPIVIAAFVVSAAIDLVEMGNMIE